MEDRDGSAFLSFSYAKLLSQLAEPYDSVQKELQMVRGKIAKLVNEIVSLSTDGQC